MAALKICSTMSWMYVVVLLIGWRDVQSHVLIERWVNPPISSISLHLSTLYVILSYRCFCAGNRPLLSLRGELRQWKCWPPRSLRNGRGCQWCEQGHHRAVWRSCWGRSQQVHRWDVTVFTWNMGFFFWFFFFEVVKNNWKLHCWLVGQVVAVWSLDQSWASRGLMCSVTMKMDLTSCSRIMEMGLLLTWQHRQVRMKW